MRHIFIDESSQNAHQFMVLGALILPGGLVTEAEQVLNARLENRRMTAELKWTKVSKQKLSEYRETIDFHFEWLVPRGASFQSLIVNCHELDHRRFNDGDPDLGFNKFLYQLLFHKVGRVFCDSERVVVDMDARSSTRDVGELQRVLNSATRRVHGHLIQPPFSRVAYRNSKSTRLLQVADLLAGAVAWHKNDHDARPNPSEAKSTLANHVAGCVGLKRLGANSSRSEHRLGIWNFRMQPRR